MLLASRIALVAQTAHIPCTPLLPPQVQRHIRLWGSALAALDVYSDFKPFFQANPGGVYPGQGVFVGRGGGLAGLHTAAGPESMAAGGGLGLAAAVWAARTGRSSGMPRFQPDRPPQAQTQPTS